MMELKIVFSNTDMANTQPVEVKRLKKNLMMNYLILSDNGKNKKNYS